MGGEGKRRGKKRGGIPHLFSLSLTTDLTISRKHWQHCVAARGHGLQATSAAAVSLLQQTVALWLSKIVGNPSSCPKIVIQNAKLGAENPHGHYGNIFGKIKILSTHYLLCWTFSVICWDSVKNQQCLLEKCNLLTLLLFLRPTTPLTRINKHLMIMLFSAMNSDLHCVPKKHPRHFRL